MKFVRYEQEKSIAIITMSREKANALSAAMVGELNEAVDAARADDAVKAVVLASDQPRFFSSGFDAKEVFAYDRDAMTVFWEDFARLYDGLFRLDKPVIGALSGHTYAGGMVLALSCDVRIMARGPFGAAVSGINLGIPLPYPIMQMAIHAVGLGHARHLFLTGETIDPQRAYEIGFARELAEPEDVLATALKHAHILATKSGPAYGAIKSMFRELSDYDASAARSKGIEKFIDFWYSEEATARRDALIASLAAK